MPDVEQHEPLGRQIQKLRLSAGMTQEALAERAGVGVRTVQRIEAGEARPSRHTLERLVGTLGLPRGQRSRGQALASASPRRRDRSTPRIGRASRHNLPEPLTSFVGRERELTEVPLLLANSRLVTLTGPGGSGKTRLALEVASDLLGDYPEGVWWVDLAPIADPSFTAPSIAARLGLVEQAGNPILSVLLDYLRRRRCLLVLDNCEHLVDECASLVDTLLRACPSLAVLATSREALRIDGETVLQVPPLAVPDPERLPPLGELLEYGGIRLLVERAARIRPGFDLTARNSQSIARICSRLDGLPLAIELAAARMGLLTPEEVARRLDDCFALLTGGSRVALPRQQTLYATIDWSHDLLAEPERRLFRRLAAFVGSFRLEDAEAVCPDATLPKEQVLSLLGALEGKSLVLVQDAGGESAYHLLETIRQFAWEALVRVGEVDAVAARHRAWYLELAVAASPRLWGSEQAEWLERLNEEHPNFRAILAWCRDHDTATGQRLANSLWRFWVDRGYLTEGRDWLESMLDRAPERTWLRARTLYSLGYLLETSGEVTSAKLAHDESLSIFEDVGDMAGSGVALVRLGRVAKARGEYRTARSHLERALRILSTLGDLPEPGDRAHVGIGEVELGEITRLEGDNRRALELFEQGLATFSRLPSQRGMSYSYWHIGRLRLSEGRHAEARRWLEESLRLARGINHGNNTYSALIELAALARVEGDYAKSRTTLEECLTFCRESGRQDKIGWVLMNMAKLALLVGRSDRAATLLRDSLLDASGRDDPPLKVFCLGLGGMLAIRQGASRLGSRLIAAATASNELIHSAVDPDERLVLETCIEEAREALGEQAFGEAWAEGQAMTLEQAVEYALQETA